VAVPHAELALRVEDVDVEPQVRLGQPVAARPGIGQQREGSFDIPGRRRHQGKTPAG
jgi:hypothetical protein